MSYRDLLIEVGTEELPPKSLELMSLALEDLIKKALKVKTLILNQRRLSQPLEGLRY